MSAKRTTNRAESGQDEPETGLLGGSTPWRLSPRSDVQLVVAKPPSTDRQTDCILILSGARLVQEALAAVLTHTLGCLDIRAATSLPEVQAQLNRAILDLVIIDATTRHSLAAAMLLKQSGLGVQIIAFGLEDAVDPIAAWSKAGIGTFLGNPVSLKKSTTSQTARAGCESAKARRSGTPQRSADHLPRTANPSVSILTAREEEVGRLIMLGESNKDIARSLNISVATVKSHVHNVLAKLGLKRRGKLVRWHEGRLLAQQIQPPSQQDTIVVPADGPGECPNPLC
jgi:DNA-binding NarL/FixJ family response regulator